MMFRSGSWGCSCDPYVCTCPSYSGCSYCRFRRQPWSCGLSLAYSPLGSNISCPTLTPVLSERSSKSAFAMVLVVLDLPVRVMPNSAVRCAMKSLAWIETGTASGASVSMIAAEYLNRPTLRAEEEPLSTRRRLTMRSSEGPLGL